MMKVVAGSTAPVPSVLRVVETLWEDGERRLSRCASDGSPSPVLVLAAVHDPPPASVVKRLEQEYALRTGLDPQWAVRPLELRHEAGRILLVLEDPGGRTLDRMTGTPFEIGRFLRIAIQLAAALGQVHRRGLIHKDIKPAHVLVDANDQVRLTGFGLASRLSRERQAMAPPAVISGTLAYMAPEQTGRMNRSIDTRSDLYALGVTFYEMLTGNLPFAAADPMEWIHCHIARQPVPPSERVASVPAQLSALVMKLLAKTAEERYQTAAGVEVDLRRCATLWQACERLDAFALGTQDASDRLMIPERLYGREAEVATLLAAFERVVAYGATEFVLVSGYSGIGKSSVVNELHKALISPHALFVSGKFDQHKRDIPYASLAQAFQSLIRPLLGQGEAELRQWRETLREALGPNGALIVNLVPELEFIIGKQPPVAGLSPQETQTRFQMVVRRFVGVFARREHPLALFLDDLQWLDAATLDVLEHLVIHPEVRHLLLIGAYRNNEVHAHHPVMRMLKELRPRARVHELVLAPLALRDVECLIADSFHCVLARTRFLARLVQEKTAGNPFFVTQFIRALVEEELIAFDQNGAVWHWDMVRIRAKGFTDNVVDLMVGKLTRLPEPTQNALKLLACLGNTAESATLGMLQGEPDGGTEGGIEAQLWAAVRAGLVFRLEGSYAFVHDRVQEAAYSLIAIDQRAAMHLRIGSGLVAGLQHEKLTEQVFDVVNQFNHAIALLSDRDEIERVAELNLRAGRKAKASTAYASACRHLDTGMALLGPSGWATCHALAFDLMLEHAACTFLSSQFDAAKALIAELLERAASKFDKAVVYRLKVELHVVESEHAQAVDTALECLRLFGMDMQAHPTREEVNAEYEKIWRNLGGRSIESLIDLPRATARDVQAAMRLLTACVSPAFFTDPNLFELVVCQMVNLTLEHGMMDASTHGYGWFGRIQCCAFRRYADGYRFGRLALDLIEKRGFDFDPAQVQFAMGQIVSWMQPLAVAIDFFRMAFRTAIETGNLIFAANSASQVIIRLILTGQALDEVWRESEIFMDLVGKIGFRDGTDLIVSQQRFIAAMRGKTTNLSRFGDAAFDERAFEESLTADRMTTMVAWYWILKIGTGFLSGDYEQALAAADTAARLLWATSGEIQLLDYHLYSALARAAGVATTPAPPQGTAVARITEHREWLQAWAQNAPETFASAAALVDAELARIENRPFDAMRLYELAIQAARAHGRIQHEGIAHELAAEFYLARGSVIAGRAYLEQARSCFARWGAEGKVRQLEQRHPALREPPLRGAPIGTLGAHAAQLDIATVIKASQTVSGEIELSKLTGTLMRIAIENAGAERGLLILFRDDEPRIEAEGVIGAGQVEVTLRQAPVTPSELPNAVLQYVSRTRESVILDDAAAPSLFAADSYVQQRQPRSVLCLPLVKQTKLVGVLYLENNLTPDVFTPDRIAVLELLASQAAISLENAVLYADLQQENANRRRAEEELRHSETFLAEGQRISHTGSWGWNISTGKLVWSEEHCRIFGWDPKMVTPTFQLFLDRVHPEDRAMVQKIFDSAIRGRAGFSFEFRIALPEGSTKYLHGMGHPVVTSDEEIYDYIGTTMDITERKRGEEALRNAQADLTRVARLTTMGELAASIAHEINQPLGAMVVNGNACLSWLAKDQPKLDEARRAAERIVRDGHRAGDIVRSVRALVGKSAPAMTQLDINAAIHEVLVLLHSEFLAHDVQLETELSDGLAPVMGDRVQLQQVVLNLIMNGIEAMSTVTQVPRILGVKSQLDGRDHVLVAVEDSGPGFAPEAADRLFEAFFTTKPSGMGMGLSVCHSIINAHGGRLWASPGSPRGAVFKFTVPSACERAETCSV